MSLCQHQNEVFWNTCFAWHVFALLKLLLQIYHIVSCTTWAKIRIFYCLYLILKHFFLDIILKHFLQEGGDDSVDNFFNDTRDDGHLAAEQEAREEAEIERRENLQEKSASALVDLSLSSKTSQESGTESAAEIR